MTNIPLPRLLKSENGSMVTDRVIRPISLSVNLSITPLSYASMQLPRGESLPARGFVELYTSIGSVGVFRVRSPQDAYGEDVTTAELEHAIVEVGDYIITSKYDKMVSASEAMTTAFRHYRGDKWQLGSVAALGSDKIALQVEYDGVLGVMLAILDQKPNCMMSFDFSTTPWTVNIVSRGDTVAAEGRLSRNVNSAKVIYDDTELCTRCYYEYESTSSDGSPSSAWGYVDADTQSVYGLVERTVSTGGSYTASEALSVANAYIAKHKEPRVSVVISAEELSSITGESFDTFTIGKLCRLALVDYGVTVERVITGVSWDNVFDSPEDITVSLEDEEDTAITFLHDLDAKGGSGGGGGGGGGGGAKKKQDDQWKEYRTRIQQTDYFIDLTAQRVDRNDNILQQAGLYIDSKGVLQYAQDNENMWASKLAVQANRISLVVEGSGSNASIKAASITAAINNSGSSITISANKIMLDGSTTLNTALATTLNCQALSAISVYANSVQGNYFMLSGNTNHAVWKSKTVVTGASNSTLSNVAIADSSNTVVSRVKLSYVKSSNLDTDTIYYLGHS